MSPLPLLISLPDSLSRQAWPALWQNIQSRSIAGWHEASIRAMQVMTVAAQAVQHDEIFEALHATRHFVVPYPLLIRFRPGKRRTL